MVHMMRGEQGTGIKDVLMEVCWLGQQPSPDFIVTVRDLDMIAERVRFACISRRVFCQGFQASLNRELLASAERGLEKER